MRKQKISGVTITMRYDLIDVYNYLSFWINEYDAIKREIAEFGEKYEYMYEGKANALRKLQEVVKDWINTNQIQDNAGEE